MFFWELNIVHIQLLNIIDRLYFKIYLFYFPEYGVLNPEVTEEVPKPRPPTKAPPIPFDPDENDVSDTWGWVSSKQFHNYFYEGFYAPFILNPDYMLIIDTRSEEAFHQTHIVTSQWHGHVPLQDNNLVLNRYSIIILCDQDGTADENSTVRRIQHCMIRKDASLEPMIIRGGMEVIEKQFPYMLTGQSIRAEERPTFISWFPAIIVDFALYMGRTEHALNVKVIKTLNITHVVNLSTKAPGIFPFVSYLCIPVNNESEDTDLRSYFSQINIQISKAMDNGGRVLVHCDEGVDSSATIVIAYLMMLKGCSLADAHDYVKSLRPIIQPSEPFLLQLSDYEGELYGRKYTNTEDLWM